MPQKISDRFAIQNPGFLSIFSDRNLVFRPKVERPFLPSEETRIMPADL